MDNHTETRTDSDKQRTSPLAQTMHTHSQKRHQSKSKGRSGTSQGGGVVNSRNGPCLDGQSTGIAIESKVFHHGHGRGGHAGSENRHLKRHSNIQRLSPSKHLHMINQPADISRTSPDPSITRQRQSPPVTPGKPLSLTAYAGAKFSDPPSPAVLPKPPVHWVCGEGAVSNKSCAEMTSILKVMLKVQA